MSIDFTTHGYSFIITPRQIGSDHKVYYKGELIITTNDYSTMMSLTLKDLYSKFLTNEITL